MWNFPGVCASNLLGAAMNRTSAMRTLFVTALLIFTSFLSARPVRMWSVQELTKEADLVVVGTVSSSADAANHASPDAKADTWIAVNTTFTVDSALKGEFKDKTVAVRHHRYNDPKAEITIVDGPSFVRFDSKLKNRYLIFLRRNAEGVYEPLTGQFDPDGSFFLLTPYHQTREQPPAAGKGSGTGEK
jgi:hypothetical protein